MGPKKGKRAKGKAKPKKKVLKGYGDASKFSRFHTFNAYKNFKKAHRMIMW